MNSQYLKFGLACCFLICNFIAVNAEEYTDVDGRTVEKLSPKVRIIERPQSIPTIKMEKVRAFLNRPKIITEEELEEAGQVLANVRSTYSQSKEIKFMLKELRIM